MTFPVGCNFQAGTQKTRALFRDECQQFAATIKAIVSVNSKKPRPY